MALINSDVIPASATGGYTIDQSLRFNDNDSSYLSRTPSSAGNRQKWTWSAWIKRGNIETNETLFSSKTNTAQIWLTGVNGRLRVEQYNGSGGYNFRRDFDGYHRDSGDWYHLIIVYDSAQATEADRIKAYRNGEQLGVNYTYETISQNYESEFNNSETHWLGTLGGQYFDGYMAEVHFIDGQALDQTSFGETGDYGEWKPIEYTGTYGTNGFYLDFSGTYYNDKSGNGNNFTATNLATTDVVLDSPTNNFDTWSPLSLNPVMNATLQQGATKLVCSSTYTSNPHYATNNMVLNSGKWYCEFTATGSTYFGKYARLGILNLDAGTYVTEILYQNYAVTNHFDTGTSGWAYHFLTGVHKHNNVTSSTYTSAYASGDIVMMAVDIDNGNIWWGLNGTWGNNGSGTGDPANGTYPAYTGQDFGFPVIFGMVADESDGSLYANFGQDSSFAGIKTAQNNTDSNNKGDFYYTPPSGFLAMCTANLSDPAVIPSEHFNTVLWSGDGTSSRSITGVGFQPDFTWIKSRNNANNHNLTDAVRGVNKQLLTNTTNAESSYSTYVTAFGSDGFTVGNDGDVNGSAKTYVAWNWKANGSGVSNTNGSITSTVSANQDAGFSIVKYTGQSGVSTVGHGLSKAPELIIVKDRDATNEWVVYHAYNTTAPETDYLRLDSSNATADYGFWNDTAPDSTKFTVGDLQPVNGGWGHNYIAYCFHSVEGFSKFGFYNGNGASNGAFIHTGFRPAFVMVKARNLGEDWWVQDSARDPYNDLNWARLAPSLVNAESNTTTGEDFLSNGFKFRTGNNGWNGSSGIYIYMAFAENPFKHTNAR